MASKNPGIKIPGPDEASVSVRTAFQQIVEKLGLQSTPSFAGIDVGGLSISSAEIIHWNTAYALSHAAATVGGDPLTISGQQISFGYNTTNMQVTSHQLNTIQDIATSSSPSFVNEHLTGYEEFVAITAPSTPAANNLRLYAVTEAGFTMLERKGPTGLTFRVNQDTFRIAQNSTALTITKGQVVFYSGSSAGEPTVALAKGVSGVGTMPCVGFATASVAPGAFGFFLVIGRLTGLDTSMWSSNDILYVSDTTAGAVIKTQPLHPHVVQAIAVVEVVDATNGVLLVNCGPNLKGEESGTRLDQFSIGGGSSDPKTLRFYGGTYSNSLTWNVSLTENHTISLPEATGTVALTSDLHSAVTTSGLTGITLTGQQLSLTTGYVIPTTTEESNWNSAYGASHARQHGIASTADHTSSITSGKMIKADANGLPSEATNTDTEVASAISLKHAAATIGGDPLSISGQQISFNYNTTNLKITSQQLNTIQDIASASSPAFAGLGLSTTNPVLTLTRGSAITLGRVAKWGDNTTYLSQNLSYSGTWNLDDVTKGGTVLSMDDSGVEIRTADLGANPRTLTSRIFISAAGKLGVGTALPAETIQAVGKIRADTAFNLNGTDGISNSGTGVPTALTVSGGIVTAVTKNDYLNQAVKSTSDVTFHKVSSTTDVTAGDGYSFQGVGVLYVRGHRPAVGGGMLFSTSGPDPYTGDVTRLVVGGGLAAGSSYINFREPLQNDATAVSYFAGSCYFGGSSSAAANVHAAAYIRADSGFNVNGTNGVSGSFTTVDLKTVTVVGGIITAIV